MVGIHHDVLPIFGAPPVDIRASEAVGSPIDGMMEIIVVCHG